MQVSTRTNSEHNVAAQIIYNDTAELHNLLENIKSIPCVTSLQWSEMVEMLGDNSHLVITPFLIGQSNAGIFSPRLFLWHIE